MDARRRRFERLLEPHHDAVLAFARCVSRSRADGDDLFQAALLRAFDNLDGLRDEAAFRPWLYRIVVTTHRNAVRRSFWRRLVPFDGHDDGAAPVDQRAPAADEALGRAQRARQALATLPAEQREAIVLFEIEGWTVEEIAAAHDVSISAVKSRLARGRERLRQFYTHRLEPAAPVLALPGDAP
ncbi:MAG TPA: sigma-70 family RNA polymerase sigma factor [Kofleriaceae bacterium]|nr:sigma-70 family RNA polymerase sigma factor [Kofleriaceae bacterium]